MIKFRTLFTVYALLITYTALGQDFTVGGKILDSRDKSPMPNVTTTIAPLADTADKKGTVTDVEGNFSIDNITPGKYLLNLSYIGYEPVQKTINVISNNIDIGTISITPSPTTLRAVTIKEQLTRAEQMGDTMQFNAGAFKTNPDATAEDLLRKMPGISRENGKMTVGGEEVQKVLVDGKPFFGDDPETAIKNLPAEIIDKVQVFDKMSEQAQFTGFDDGESEKTINIKTKKGKNKGNFGKAYGGYGTDNRYLAGGNINHFNGAERISLIAMTNNINQQNFSTDDLLGALGSSGNQRGGRRSGRGSDISNFLVGQQGGITTTNAAGLNYSNNWGKKAKLTASYFFNQTNNDNNTRLSRQYFTSADSNLVYNEANTANTKNLNHRFNARFDYSIDSNNSITLKPRLSFQEYHYTSVLTGGNTLPGDVLNSRLENRSSYYSNGYNLSNEAIYRHRFRKKGRTISLDLRTDLNNNGGNGLLYSLNEFVNSDTTLLNQQSDVSSNGHSIITDIEYTEPVGKYGQVELEYRPTFSTNFSNKEVDNYDITTGSYSALDTLLSNKYNNTYNTQHAGLSYGYNHDKVNFSFGLRAQESVLSGSQEFPFASDISRNFRNIIPRGMLNYKFSKSKNLRVYYRGDVDAPSISQLQSVINNSNPLLLSTGNANLVQDYEHRLFTRYSAVNTTTNRNFYMFLFANYIFDYIGRQTFIPTRDTLFENDVLINKGAQLSRPVNIDGYTSLRSHFTYSLPVTFIKSNLNLGTGLRFSRTPALINNLKNFSNNYSVSGSITIGSNISENVDFTLGYNGTYNIVKNTIQAQSDNAYYTQNTSLRLNLLFLKGFVFNTDLNHYMYAGLAESFNQNFFLWNAALGYKFLKDKSLEAKLNVFDILNQNRAISRTVTETYIQDSYTQVLQQYFMLTVTYTLRNFKGDKQ